MDEMVEIFKTLSDITRIRILNLLNQGELCVCDIMNVLALPQSTVSRHLAILKTSGLISSRKEGLWHYYKLNQESELEKDLLRILKKNWKNDSESNRDLEKLESACACGTVGGACR